MAVAFPTDLLPLPVRDGFEDGLQNPFSRFKRDDGKFRLQRRFAGQTRAVSLTWKLTWEQFKFFEAFVEYDINKGALPFDLKFGPTQPVRTVRMISPYATSFDEKTSTWRLTMGVTFAEASAPRRDRSYYPTFPIGLPEPEKSEYNISALTRFIKDEDSTGSGKSESRPRFRTIQTTYSCRWIFTEPERAVFEDFVRNELAGGLAYFKAPFANGSGLNNIRARFIEPPKTIPLGALAWVVTGVLETSEAPMISEFNYRVPNGIINPADSFKLAEKIQFNFGRTMSDIIVFSEAVNFSHGHYLNDTIVFSEQVSFSGDYNIMLEDRLVFGESGFLSTQNYISDDYFAESYVGYQTSF